MPPQRRRVTKTGKMGAAEEPASYRRGNDPENIPTTNQRWRPSACRACGSDDPTNVGKSLVAWNECHLASLDLRDVRGNVVSKALHNTVGEFSARGACHTIYNK